MKIGAIATSAAVCALQAVVLLSPAVAGEPCVPRLGSAATAAAAASAPAPDWKDDAIRRAFREVLDRQPNSSEMREYRDRINKDKWTEADIRDDLMTRYRNRGSSKGRESYDHEQVDRIIRRAYQDILHREPDAEGLRHYRIEMIDKGRTEEEVRKALRQSVEHDAVKEKNAETAVRRAYADILGRAPDNPGLAKYRNYMVNDGWTERQVRDALMKSPEYREKNRMTREKAEETVKRSYRSVLGRDPDAAGLRSYSDKILREKWTEADVTKALRQSDEYKNKRKQP